MAGAWSHGEGYTPVMMGGPAVYSIAPASLMSFLRRSLTDEAYISRDFMNASFSRI
jgi:hypothetical protein